MTYVSVPLRKQLNALSKDLYGASSAWQKKMTEYRIPVGTKEIFGKPKYRKGKSGGDEKYFDGQPVIKDVTRAATPEEMLNLMGMIFGSKVLAKMQFESPGDYQFIQAYNLVVNEKPASMLLEDEYETEEWQAEFDENIQKLPAKIQDAVKSARTPSEEININGNDRFYTLSFVMDCLDCLDDDADTKFVNIMEEFRQRVARK